MRAVSFLCPLSAVLDTISQNYWSVLSLFSLISSSQPFELKVKFVSTFHVHVYQPASAAGNLSFGSDASAVSSLGSSSFGSDVRSLMYFPERGREGWREEKGEGQPL